MKKTIRSFLTAALSLAALFATGGGVAAAATPVAVWSGDFLENSKNGTDNKTYTIVPNTGNSIATDGSYIQIGDSATLGALINISSGVSKPTVVVRYENMTIGASKYGLASFQYNKGTTTWPDAFSIAADGENSKKLTEVGCNLSTVGFTHTLTPDCTPSEGAGCYAVCIDSKNAIRYYDNPYVNSVPSGWAYKGYWNTSSWQLTDSLYNSIAVGGFSGSVGSTSYGAVQGMKITGIAVFVDTEPGNNNPNFFSDLKWPNKWIGCGSGDWSDPTKWALGHVPQSDEVAVIGNNDIVNVDINAAPTGVTICGSGTVVYDGKLPGNEKTSYQATAWIGIVWLKNKTTNGEIQFGNYGNASSFIKVTDFCGYLPKDGAVSATVELDGESSDYALKLKDGYSSNFFTFAKLTGSGKLVDDNTATQRIQITDGTEFAGDIDMQKGKQVVFGATTGNDAKRIVIMSDNVAKVANGKTWTATNGIFVNGTLGGAGTLASATTLSEGAKLKPTNGGLKITAALTAPSGITIDVSDMVINDEPILPLVTLNSAASGYTVNIENAPTGYGEFISGNVIYLAKTAAIATDAESFKAKYEAGGDIILGADIALSETIAAGDNATIYPFGHSLTGGALDNNFCMVTFNVDDSFVLGSTLTGAIGMFVKDGPGFMRHYIDSNTALIDNATVSVNDGRYTIGENNKNPKLVNPVFVLNGENASLENYGWPNVTGTLTIRSNYDREIFTNTNGATGIGERSAVLTGSPRLIKNGSGIITIGLACESLSGLEIVDGELVVSSKGGYDGTHPALSFVDNATFALPEGGMTDNLITKVTGTGALNGTTHIANIKIGKVDAIVTLVFDSSAKTVSYVLPAKAKLSEAALDWSDTDTWEGGAVPTSGLVEIPAGAIVNVDANANIANCTIAGAGTIVFIATDTTKTAAPTAPSGLTTSAWTGTVWLKGYGKGVLNSGKTGGNVGFKLDNYGNTGSTVALTGIEGYLLINGGSANGTTQLKNVELIDEENVVAFTQNNGNSSDVFVFPKLSGNGTFSDGALSPATQGIRIVDGSEFTGSISLTMGRRIGFGNNIDTKGQKSIYVSEGSVVTVGDASIWTATDGIKVFGTLGGAGTLASATTFGEGAKIKPAVGGLKFGSTITGSVTIDCADIVAAGVNGSALITMTGSTKTLPTYTLENATGFEAFAKDGALYLVKNGVRDFYSRFDNNPAIFTWNGGNADFANGKILLFDGLLGEEVVPKFEVTNNQSTEGIPGHTDAVMPWHLFCGSGNSTFDSHVDPNYVLRVEANHGADQKTIDGSYNDMIFGGLIVESGATGFSLKASGNRPTRIGDMRTSGGVDTWFVFNESFEIQRGQANNANSSKFTIFGSVNFDIAANKNVTINTNYTAAYPTLDTGTHAVLKMHGSGTLTVANLIAAGDVTLDYSALASDCDPYIIGGITVDANTTFKFPAGFEPTSEEEPSFFKLCSGTITGPERISGANIYVGGVKLSGKELIFDLQNGKVSYQDITAPKITVTEDISITDVEGQVTSGYTGLVELDFESDGLALIIDKTIPFSSILLKCDDGLVTLAAEDKDGAYVPVQADFDKLNWNDVSVANKRIYRNIAPFGSAPAAGMTYRYEGTKALDDIPYAQTSVAGTIEIACPISPDENGKVQVFRDKNIIFDGDFGISASAFICGNKVTNGDASPRQIITQNKGVMTLSNSYTGADTTSEMPLLFAHWPSVCTYNLVGGSIIAENGNVMFGRDGTIAMTVGGGATEAIFKARGINWNTRYDKGDCSLTISNNGVVQVGVGGIDFHEQKKVVLNGGTLGAYDTATISTTLPVEINANSTFDVADNKELSVTSSITGSGSITKTGAGTLKFDNSHLFYGSQISTGTELVIAGGTLDLNGAYTWATDGSGFLTQKPITLGGVGATTITGGNVTFYSNNSNNIVYDGGNGANAPAEFAANWHGSYSNNSYTRNINVGKGAGTDYDLLISGTIGLSGAQFSGTIIHKTGVGTVKMTGEFNIPTLSIDAGTWKMGANGTLAATTTIGANTTLDVNGQTATVATLTGVGEIINSAETAASINITSAATISGNISGVSLVSQGGTITVAEGATVGESVGFVVDLDEAVIGATPFVFADDSLYGKVTTKGESSALAYDPDTHTIVYGGKKLSDTMIWLPIGDSITEGEQYMGHSNQGNVETRGGYRYQLYSQLTDAGMSVRSVGYRTGHMATVEPDDCPWAWHAAQYGGVIAHDSNGTHGGALFNVENTLQVAGYPDVITILLGVNDLSMNNPSAENIYDSMDAMVKKIAKMRPNSKILVSTLLPAGGSRGYIDTYNTLLREKSAQIASPFDLPNVKLIDVNSKFGAYADAYFKTDHLHPNEVGSIKVAKSFMGFVATAIGEIVDGDTKMVHVHNGESGYVVVRFSKALNNDATATLTIAGTDVDGNAVEVAFENGAVDTDDKRVMRFAIPQGTTLKGGVYTATLSAIDTTTLASDFVEIQGAGAEENIGAAYRDGFLRYGTVTFSNGTIIDGIGSGDNWQGNGPTIQVDRSDVEGVDIKRVGYYLELKRANEPSQFVWVSMDAFNTSLSNLLVPTAASGAHKAKVTNLQVFANRANVTNTTIDNGVVDTTQTGVVEFTPWGWNGNEQAGYPNDIYSSRTGWNDTLEMSAGTLKGGMQVFRYTDEATVDTFTKFAAETVFAVNNFNCDTAMDLGIGSFSTHRNNAGGNNTIACTWDWSDFVNNSKYTKFAVNAYEVKKMEIWVVPMTKTVWTGEGADNNWNTKENWSTGAVPASYADVEIPANAEIVLNDDIAIASLTITDASASITGTGSIKVTNLAASTLKGIATIALPEGEIPNADLRAQLSASDWKGTIIIKNYGSFRTSDNHVGTELSSDMVNWGNGNSKVQFTGVFACLPNSDSSALTIPWELVLIDNETPYLNYTHAWYNDNGYSRDNSMHSFAKLSGSGMFYDSFSGCTQIIKFGDVSKFTGKINIAGKRLIIGNTEKMTDAGSIAIADGAIVNAGVLTASKIKFGATIKIPNATLDQVFVTGLTAEPASIPGVLNEVGNTIGLALKYEEGVGGAPNEIRLVEAGAQTESGKSYETIEEAINSEESPTIKVAADAAPLAIENITVGKTFNVHADTKANFDWDETTGKYLALTTAGLMIKEGTPANPTFTGEEGATKKLVALGLDASSETDKPFLKQVGGAADTITFDFFHGTDGTVIEATGIGRLPVKYSVEYADTLDFTGSQTTGFTTESLVSVELPTASDKKVHYYRPKFSFGK